MIFDWDTHSYLEVPGVITIPRISEYDGPDRESFFDTKIQNNEITGLMLRKGEPNAGEIFDLSEDFDALNEVMSYLASNEGYLNFVFADFESGISGLDQSSYIELVNQVRSHENSNINSAYIGAYSAFPGETDYSHPHGEYNRTEEHNFYMDSGLNIAMPVLYSYTVYAKHAESTHFGANIAVSVPHALFWSALERYSTAKRNLPADHLIIPWIGGLIINGNYAAPSPSKIESRSLLQHARLRGADGYYTWEIDQNTNYSDDADLRDDMLHNSWKPLDWFFNRPGKNNILNLTTNKTGGVEWSGVRRGNQAMFIFSNYTNGSQQVDLPDDIENIPDLSPVVAQDEHLIMNYVIGPTSYWAFNDNSNDEMAASNDATAIVDGTWVTGKFENALLFGGGYATIPDSNSLDLSDEITVSFWMNPATYHSSHASHPLRKRVSTTGANFDMGATHPPR